MAKLTLVVDVVSANGFLDSLGLLNPCVELLFAGHSFTTSVKKEVRCPIWNERVLFRVPDRQSLAHLNLEAHVCNVVTDGSKSVLGKVRLSGSSFTDSSNEIVRDYELKGSMLRRSKGILLLRVFLRNEPPVIASNPLSCVAPSRPLRQSVHVPPCAVEAASKEIKPKFEHGLIVECMPYIFVRVVKARNLPRVKAPGGLDPRVEVKFGDYIGKTEWVQNEQNPEWNTTFTFSKLEADRDHLTRVYVVVTDVDMVDAEFVGMVPFDVRNITHESPVQNWYNLLDASGKQMESQLMLAVWMGSQADEAFPGARKSDLFHLDISMLPHFGSKVYDLPSLWYVRVHIAEFTCNAVEGGAKLVEMYAIAAVGSHIQKTKILKKPLACYAWEEDLMFVAAEPFEDDLQIYVRARLGPDDRNEVIVGRISIKLHTVQGRVGDSETPAPQWYDLQNVAGEDELTISSCRISVGNCLEGRYNVSIDSLDYSSDLRPTSRKISDPPIVGMLEVGILRAEGLPLMERNGSWMLPHPYCVAKYSRKWLRTRTIYSSRNPVFNEQNGWEVYDTATVLTVCVFHNSEMEGKAVKIGRLMICLSSLQPGRTYGHSYPLLVLTPSGLKKKGQLHLAVRFSSESVVRMLRMYSSPMLPQIYYEHQLPAMLEDNLRSQAVKLVASHMSRMEPPLRKEVVEFMCSRSTGSSFFSFRKSKANFFRVMEIVSIFIKIRKWFAGVRSWDNPATNLLVYVVFFGALLYHQFILPALFLYMFFITVWNYRWRPTSPPHVDAGLSYADKAHPDELGEEFDTFPTSERSDLLQMRYDRLRSVAGRIQTIVGDAASHGERIRALASWRDPTATAMFGIFTLSVAIVLYFTPWKILAAVAGVYITRPPMLRRKKNAPSFLLNFYMRLPNVVAVVIKSSTNVVAVENNGIFCY